MSDMMRIMLGKRIDELEIIIIDAIELLDKECYYCKLNGVDIEHNCPICLVPQARTKLSQFRIKSVEEEK